MTIGFEFINGICFGAEHVSFEEDEDYLGGWMVAIHFLCFRLCLIG